MQIAGVGDFNGDGKADMLLRNTDGTITDWLGQADGSFIDNSATASQPLDLSLQIAGVGDFNGDGKADMLVQWSDGTLQAWTGSDAGAILSPIEKQWNDAMEGMQAMGQEMAREIGTAMATAAAMSDGGSSSYSPAGINDILLERNWTRKGRSAGGGPFLMRLGCCFRTTRRYDECRCVAI